MSRKLRRGVGAQESEGGESRPATQKYVQYNKTGKAVLVHGKQVF